MHLPDVQSVGGVHLLPMGDSNWDPGLRIEDRPLPAGSSHGTVNWRLVTSDYFAAMKIPLLRGRSFGASDDESGEKVALINATLARKYWPGEDPIGKRIGSGFEGKGKWVTVVGVVGDIKQHGLGVETRPEMYRPYFQHTSLPPMTLMVRTISAPAPLAASIRSAVWSIDKNVPITDLQPMTEVVARSIAQPRSTMLMLSVFAGIGLTLGIIGIYGVISYSVAQRTQEIGVRMALGARAFDVLRLVVGQGLKLTLFGVVGRCCRRARGHAADVELAVRSQCDRSGDLRFHRRATNPRRAPRLLPSRAPRDQDQPRDRAKVRVEAPWLTSRLRLDNLPPRVERQILDPLVNFRYRPDYFHALDARGVTESDLLRES